MCAFMVLTWAFFTRCFRFCHIRAANHLATCFQSCWAPPHAHLWLQILGSFQTLCVFTYVINAFISLDLLDFLVQDSFFRFLSLSQDSWGRNSPLCCGSRLVHATCSCKGLNPPLQDCISLLLFAAVVMVLLNLLMTGRIALWLTWFSRRNWPVPQCFRPWDQTLVEPYGVVN